MKKDRYLVGFTKKTRRIIPRLFCRKYRHCAVVDMRLMILVQVGADSIRFMSIDARAIERLRANGWVFISVLAEKSERAGLLPGIINCVGFTKRVLGIRRFWIVTPLQLYNYLKKREAVIM